MKFFVDYTIYRAEADTLEVTKCKGDPKPYPNSGVLCRQEWAFNAELDDEIWVSTSWKTITEADSQAAAIYEALPIIKAERIAMGCR